MTRQLINRCFFFWLVIFPAFATEAGQSLFDFETQEELSAWTLRSPKQDKLSVSEDFATQGGHSLLFKTPAWKEGMEEWPAFEAKPAVEDWRDYDRLLVDVTNPHQERYHFSLFVTDDKVPFREGLSFKLDLPAKGFERYLVPLSRFPDKVDRSRISLLHFFSQRPTTNMALHIDNLQLLRPGEIPPSPPSSFVQQVASLFTRGEGAWEDIRRKCHRALSPFLEEKKTSKAAEEALKETEESLATIQSALEAPELTLKKLTQLQEELDRLPQVAKRRASVLQFTTEFDKKIDPKSPILVGFASSMVKLLPRDMPFDVTVSRQIQLALAKNEKESFQVAVLPRETKLEDVSVQIGPLTSKDGSFPEDQIDCDVMGYVKTEKRPPYAVPYVGWWPDPILDFLGPVDIDPQNLQSFWIRVRAPKKQQAGVYRGTLTVGAGNADPLQFELAVRVYDFTLPDHTPLPTAITFSARTSQMGGEENWNRMKHVYADFLADYCIDYDSLYRQGPPDYEVVQRLHDQGRLVAFNLGNVFNAGTSETGFDQAIAATVNRIRPAYEKAKELGFLNHAYIYGFDERPKDQFPLLERSAKALREAFPEVLLMTTSYDNSYGLDSCVKTIDAWCPLTARYDQEQARQAREQGKKVWWYICCGPHHPFANWFVDYDGIEPRLIMGPMTIKYRPDGFLYYSLTIWNQNQPITGGPFTEWNPVSWTVYHGDGSIFCCGPGGKPVPTIRLENYRDGQEDYAYACILEEILRIKEAPSNDLKRRERRWLQEAREALLVPDSLVEGMGVYTRDPQEVYDYRDRLAELIERSGVRDADPWGDDFGVRGFKK